MVRVPQAILLFTTGAAVSVRFGPGSHVPSASTGCGKEPRYTPGRTDLATAKFQGVTWHFRVRLPKSYNKHAPIPLIIQHPGWGSPPARMLYNQGDRRMLVVRFWKPYPKMPGNALKLRGGKVCSARRVPGFLSTSSGCRRDVRTRAKADAHCCSGCKEKNRLRNANHHPPKLE